jgi:hypothetical protein
MLPSCTSPLTTKLNNFNILTKAQYGALPNAPKANPMVMCILIIKVYEGNRPIQAKPWMVILRNLDNQAWTKAECFAPVIPQDSLRLLLSISVQMRCIAKQGDCKNTFCQPSLLDGKAAMMTLPPGCL